MILGLGFLNYQLCFNGRIKKMKTRPHTMVFIYLLLIFFQITIRKVSLVCPCINLLKRKQTNVHLNVRTALLKLWDWP